MPLHVVVKERLGSGSPAAAWSAGLLHALLDRPGAALTFSRAARLSAFVLIAQALEERRNSHS